MRYCTKSVETMESVLTCFSFCSVTVFLTCSVYGLVRKRISLKNYAFYCSRSIVDLAAVFAVAAGVYFSKACWRQMLLENAIFASMAFNLAGLSLKLFSVALPLVAKKTVTKTTCYLIMAFVCIIALVWSLRFMVSKKIILYKNVQNDNDTQYLKFG